MDPIGTYFTEQDENGLWKSITDEEAKAKFGKSAGEVKGEYEAYGPKLILSDYYATTFEMEPRAVERLTDLYDYWMTLCEGTPPLTPSTAFTPRTSWTPSTSGGWTLKTSWQSRRQPGCATAASPMRPGMPTRRT